MINSILELQCYLVEGYTDWGLFGDVKATYREDLVLFNYTAMAAINNRWNFFERVSRGLILDQKTGAIVARPPDKFFNWGEGGREGSGKIQHVFEKLDGSFGILYRLRGEYRIATRGSFVSDQAIWATNHLHRHHNLDGLSDDLTLFFEILFPSNRIVVDYGDREDLVLLGARHLRTAKYLSWSEVEKIARKYGFSLPEQYTFSSVGEIAKITQKCNTNFEGFVVHMDNGEWWKFKGEEYRRVHKIISQFSFKNTLLAMKDGHMAQLMESVPDCFLDPVLEHVEAIKGKEVEIIKAVEAAFAIAPKKNRKEFAQWVMATHKNLSPYLFAMLDEKPLKSLIFKHAFT
jgi:RNA ligase